MTASLGKLPAQAIVLMGTDESVPSAVPPGTTMMFRVDLTNVVTVEGLVAVVSAELLFPHEASGLDAMLDLMSDLDWFGRNDGYVVEFEGLDDLGHGEPELLARFVALLPSLCDRWRSRKTPFRVLLGCGNGVRSAVRASIDEANAAIEEASKLPWLADLAPVEVVECR